jgi:energy-coupling factor transport system ATP-binding protein
MTEVNVRIEPGTITVLTGATGSGKSTLLASLTGLFQYFSGGDQNGIIEIGGLNRARTLPRETADFVSFVSQNVRSTFVAPTVREEISYGLVVRGASRVEVDDRVSAVSQQLGLATLLDRPVETLSAGEATIVAIGAALVTQPSLLILDEPLADLDGPATARVLSILCDLAADTQIPIVIAEHRTVELTTIATHWLRIVKGRLEEGIFESEPLPFPGELSGSPSVALRASIRSLTVRHGAAPVVSDVSFDIFAGDIFAFKGHNGAGKTSLLNALAQPHSAGNTYVDGVDLKTVRPRERRRLVALVPEHYENLLFCSSVARECEVADRRARTPQGTTLGLFTALLDGALQHEPPLLDIHPRDLSTGQRLALVIAIQLAAAPRLLLIDEPTRGLDPQARRELTRILHRVARPSSVIGATPSTAVIFASHDRDFIEATATKTFEMTAGRLTPVGEAASSPASTVTS